MKNVMIIVVVLVISGVVNGAIEYEGLPEDNCRSVDGVGVCSGTPQDGRMYYTSRDAERQGTAYMEENKPAYVNLNGTEPPREKKDPEGVEEECPKVPETETTRSKRQAGTVENCQEQCYSHPWSWVLTPSGVWRKPVQLWWFKQYFTKCTCPQKTCSGQNSCSGWWGGKCVLERIWKKVLVWKSWWPFVEWIWIKMDVGCCCVPWGYN